LNEEQFRRLKVLFGFLVLACLINPYFLKGAFYPIKVLFHLGDSATFFSKIQELQKPLDWSSLFSLNQKEYKLLIILSLSSFLLQFKRMDLGLFALWLFFLLFSLTALRNVAYFALASYFVILANTVDWELENLWDRLAVKSRTRLFLSLLIKAAVIIGLIQYLERFSLNGYYDFQNYVRKSEFGGVSLRNFPRSAADFLAQHRVEGNFFNDFNSGAYLAGRASPAVKIFIDGRTEVYGPKFFEMYSKIWKGDKKLFERAVKQYNLTGVFIGYLFVPAPAQLMKYLYEHPDWVLVYFDYDASIFLKNIPQNRRWIEQSRIDLSQWQVSRVDILKLKDMNVTPYQHMNRAGALFSFGLYDSAESESREALRISPDYSKPYFMLGEIYLKKKMWEKAYENLRIAENLTKDDAKIRRKMKFAYQKILKNQ